jgi:hypothetical protein
MSHLTDIRQTLANKILAIAPDMKVLFAPVKPIDAGDMPCAVVAAEKQDFQPIDGFAYEVEASVQVNMFFEITKNMTLEKVEELIENLRWHLVEGHLTRFVSEEYWEEVGKHRLYGVLQLYKVRFFEQKEIDDAPLNLNPHGIYEVR